MRFQNKTVIVTGAGNGIGKGIAEEFARQGAKVVVAEINEGMGKEFAEKLGSEGREALFIETDVKRPESVEAMVRKAAEHFGSIDILINNAGISKFHDFFQLTPELWDEVLNTNLRSVFLCSQAAARYMKGKGGSIINIASTRAFMSEPDTEAYSASKGGIVAITHALARTLGPHDISVNCISPGWIETKNYGQLSDTDHSQHLSGRVGKPQDIARACLFLADPENDFITGENLMIDGGMTKKMMYEE